MTIIMEESDVKSVSSIQRFYSGQSIFITGGTGFLGILLVEKLLRTCADLSMIYLLIRPKKGIDAKQRLDKIFEELVYNHVKAEVPNYREKICLVEGDCSLPGLGMSAKDRKMLTQKVSIVFHAAASLNFDLNLKNAITTNIVSTKDIMEMCREMHHLKAVIYVSTAFCNSVNTKKIEEKIYDPPMNYKHVIQLTECLSGEVLEDVKHTILGKYPDTYIFSKCISESVVGIHGKDLPAGVFRPVMVTTTYKEPLEGWINNLYGPMGVAVGYGTGILRTMLADSNVTAQIVPADYTVNALITAAWDVANRKTDNIQPLVYNYNPWNVTITWGQQVNMGKEWAETFPSGQMIWYWSFNMTKYWYFHVFHRIFQHLIPALFIDLGLRAVGRKPMMLKLYRKIHKFVNVLYYYSSKNFKFSNENVINLWNRLSEQDQELFFFSMKDFDWDHYIKNYVMGVRVYLLHEDPSTIPWAKKRFQRLKTLHFTLKYIILILVIYFVVNFIRSWWS